MMDAAVSIGREPAQTTSARLSEIPRARSVLEAEIEALDATVSEMLSRLESAGVLRPAPVDLPSRPEEEFMAPLAAEIGGRARYVRAIRDRIQHAIETLEA